MNRRKAILSGLATIGVIGLGTSKPKATVTFFDGEVAEFVKGKVEYCEKGTYAIWCAEKKLPNTQRIDGVATHFLESDEPGHGRPLHYTYNMGDGFKEAQLG